MGADIYLRKKYEKHSEKYQKKFDVAIKERDDKRPESAEHKKAQKNVEKWYDLMLSKGYFRDSYNDSNLLWKMDLSWWEWANKYCDEEGEISPDKLKLLLVELDVNKSKLDNYDFENDKEREYFEQKYKDLTGLIQEAIDLNEPLEFSV